MACNIVRLVEDWCKESLTGTAVSAVGNCNRKTCRKATRGALENFNSYKKWLRSGLHLRFLISVDTGF